MSDKKSKFGSKTQQGHALIDSSKENPALCDTLPGSKPQTGNTLPDTRTNPSFDDTLPGIKPAPPRKFGQGAGAADIFTSAPVRTVSSTEQTSGSVTLSGERVAESLARELIVRRMSQEGIELQADYPFSCGELLVTLDGFDEKRRVGYQFISHSGDDVVTDFDEAVEQRIHSLAHQGVVHILVIHDHNAREVDEVIAAVEDFLAALPR